MLLRKAWFAKSYRNYFPARVLLQKESLSVCALCQNCGSDKRCSWGTSWWQWTLSWWAQPSRECRQSPPSSSLGWLTGILQRFSVATLQIQNKQSCAVLECLKISLLTEECPLLCLNVCLSFRDLLPSAEMTATADPRQIHIASHLGPAVPQHSSMPSLLPSRIYPGPGSKALPAAPRAFWSFITSVYNTALLSLSFTDTGRCT